MPLSPNLRCGVAGWSYPHWDDVVYSRPRARSSHPLELISRHFDAVEIDSTFYQPVRPEVARLWIAKVAQNRRFQFTAKLHRRFTHDRSLDQAAIAASKDGLWPLLAAGKLGCVLMQFPWSFRFTSENRDFLVRLRRAFHELPLVAEMRHASWMRDEALGTLIDYNVGFCNIDQPVYTKAMPPTAYLTSRVGYVRLLGRDREDWNREFGRNGSGAARPRPPRHDYLYSPAELAEWRDRIDHIRAFAPTAFVIAANDAGGKSVVNALQIAALTGDDRKEAPAGLIRRFPRELAGYHPDHPVQRALFAPAA